MRSISPQTFTPGRCPRANVTRRAARFTPPHQFGFSVPPPARRRRRPARSSETAGPGLDGGRRGIRDRGRGGCRRRRSGPASRPIPSNRRDPHDSSVAAMTPPRQRRSTIAASISAMASGARIGRRRVFRDAVRPTFRADHAEPIADGLEDRPARTGSSPPRPNVPPPRPAPAGPTARPRAPGRAAPELPWRRRRRLAGSPLPGTDARPRRPRRPGRGRASTRRAPARRRPRRPGPGRGGRCRPRHPETTRSSQPDEFRVREESAEADRRDSPLRIAVDEPACHRRSPPCLRECRGLPRAHRASCPRRSRSIGMLIKRGG